MKCQYYVYLRASARARTHTRTYMHTYMHAYVHTYKNKYIHAYVRKNTYKQTYIHTYVRTYVHAIAMICLWKLKVVSENITFKTCFVLSLQFDTVSQECRLYSFSLPHGCCAVYRVSTAVITHTGHTHRTYTPDTHTGHTHRTHTGHTHRTYTGHTHRTYTGHTPVLKHVHNHWHNGSSPTNMYIKYVLDIIQL